MTVDNVLKLGDHHKRYIMVGPPAGGIQGNLRDDIMVRIFREITCRVACKQTFTTGRMPTGNARVESMHKTLENLVSVYISDNHKTWPDLVPFALWTIRSTTSFRTGYSPFNLLYREDPVSMGMPERGGIPE